MLKNVIISVLTATLITTGVLCLLTINDKTPIEVKNTDYGSLVIYKDGTGYFVEK